jgi:hypothetical protein
MRKFVCILTRRFATQMQKPYLKYSQQPNTLSQKKIKGEYTHDRGSEQEAMAWSETKSGVQKEQERLKSDYIKAGAAKGMDTPTYQAEQQRANKVPEHLSSEYQNYKDGMNNKQLISDTKPGSQLGSFGNLGGGDVEMGYKAGKSSDQASRAYFGAKMSQTDETTDVPTFETKESYQQKQDEYQKAQSQKKNEPEQNFSNWQSKDQTKVKEDTDVFKVSKDQPQKQDEGSQHFKTQDQISQRTVSSKDQTKTYDWSSQSKQDSQNKDQFSKQDKDQQKTTDWSTQNKDQFSKQDTQNKDQFSKQDKTQNKDQFSKQDQNKDQFSK